jgi:hypothetical protein
MKTWGLGLMSNEEKSSILDQHKKLYDGYRTMQPKVSNTQPLYIQDFANDKGGITVNNRFEVKPYMNVGINEQVSKESMCSECGGMMYEGECSECGYKGEMGEEMQQVKDLKNVEDLNLSDNFDYTEEELDEISVEDLKKGKKYKYKHPAFSDEIEFEDEYEGSDLDKMYQFKGKETHAMPKKGVEYFVDFLDEDEEDPMNFEKGERTQDPHQVGPSTDDGFGNYDDGMDEDYDVEMGETEQGNPYDNEEDAYTFVSGGPMQEDEFEEMTSAWDDDLEEITDEVEEDYLEEEDDIEEEVEESDGSDLTDLDEDIRESVVQQKNKINEMFMRMKRF